MGIATMLLILVLGCCISVQVLSTPGDLGTLRLGYLAAYLSFAYVPVLAIKLVTRPKNEHHDQDVLQPLVCPVGAHCLTIYVDTCYVAQVLIKMMSCRHCPLWHCG